jgi:hypothetical protein
MRQKSSDSDSTSGSQSGANAENASSSVGDTPCFTVQLPANIGSRSSGDCWITAEYNKDERAGTSSRVKIEPLAQHKGSLAAQVSTWKASYKDHYDITSEEPVKVGQYDATKFIFNRKGSTDTETSVLMYTGDKYKTGEGFELNGDYRSTGNEKPAMDSLIASWQWK